MSSAVNLRDLDPRAVALDACSALVEHIGRLAFVLNPHAVPLAPAAVLVDGSEFGLTVQALTEFAQRGLPAGDWTDAEMAADALLSVVSALYGGALDGAGATPGILAEGEPATALEAVLLAAWSRVQLGRGEAIEARQIACLAGMPVRTVQHHVQRGELPASCQRPARVEAEAAQAYLSARGVVRNIVLDLRERDTNAGNFEEIRRKWENMSEDELFQRATRTSALSAHADPHRG